MIVTCAPQIGSIDRDVLQDSADPRSDESDEATLLSYGLEHIADVVMTDANVLLITVTKPEATMWEKAIYAILIGGKIMRIGSSKGRLGNRLNAWTRDISGRLAGRKSPTPGWEAAQWKEHLRRAGGGLFYARPGTVISTRVGTISAYLDEESHLIGKHMPPLNRSKHR